MSHFKCSETCIGLEPALLWMDPLGLFGFLDNSHLKHDLQRLFWVHVYVDWFVVAFKGVAWHDTILRLSIESREHPEYDDSSLRWHCGRRINNNPHNLNVGAGD